MKISSVVLNWQNADATIKCVESLIGAYEKCSKELKFSGQIIIVDNGSDYIVLKKLKNWYQKNKNPLLHLIINSSNLGFSAGMNKGIFYSLNEYNPDYIWLLNNDITCSESALIELIYSAKKFSEISIWGPSIIDKEKMVVQCAGGCSYNKWLGIEKAWGKGVELNKIDSIFKCKFDYIYGAAMLVKSTTLRKFNGLNESYFLYFEELDLINRLSDKSQVGWCRRAIVFHKGGASVTNDDVLRLTTYHAALSAFKFTSYFYPYCLFSVMSARIIGKAIHSIKQKKYFILTEVIKAIFVFFTRK